MNSANRVVANTGILYARMAITIFISLYSTRLILGALGVDDFGIFNVVAGIISMLTFLNAAMASATQRYMSYAQGSNDFNRLKTIFNVSIVLHILIGVMIFFLFQVVGYILFDGVLKIPPGRLEVARLIFQFTIVSTVFTVISVPYDAVINAHEDMMVFAVLGVVEAVFKLGIAIFITYTNYDRLIVYGILMASLSIVLLIARRVYCNYKYRECDIDLRACFSKTVFKEMTGFAGWSFLGSSTSLIANYGQGIIMNIFFGAAVNAAQGISGQVSGQLSSFATTMLKALNPILDKSEGAGNRTLMIKASMIGGKVSFFLLMFFFIPVLIDMPFVFDLWLKEVPPYVVVFCRLLLIRNLIEQMFITLGSSIMAEGNIRQYKIFTSTLNLTPLIVAFVLFKLGFAAHYIYVVFIGYALCVAVITLYFAKKNLDLSIGFFLVNVISRCICTFLLVFLISYLPMLFLDHGLIRLLVIISTTMVGGIICVCFIGFSSGERLKLFTVLKTSYTRLSEKIYAINFNKR